MIAPIFSPTPATYDRFKFEQDLLTTWGITTDLHDLTTAVLERGLTPDEVANVLLGLETLYNIRFEELFRQFELSITASPR